jgi:hypothetical protein
VIIVEYPRGLGQLVDLFVGQLERAIGHLVGDVFAVGVGDCR